MKSNFFKEKILRKRVIIPVAIVVLIIIFAISGSKNKNSMMYNEELAESRDISTYLKFTGKVEAIDTKTVYSSVSAKVKEVVVKEGQKVNKGDVICYLDSSDLEYALKSKEVSLEQTKTSQAYNIKDAKTSLNNLQSSINMGLNTSLNTAQKTLLNAQDNYYKVIENYNKTYEEYLNAKDDYDTGKAYNNALVSYDFVLRLYDDVDEDNRSDFAKEMISNAEKSYNDAKQSALDAVKDLKKMADDALIEVKKAEGDLASAERDYNASLLSVNQDLQSRKDRLESAKATSSTESQELDIEHSKESLEDYTIVAPIDGYITKLNCKEGELFNSMNPLAVVENFDSMKLVVKVDEYDIGKVLVDTPVSVYVNAFDKYYDGYVESINMTATTTNDVSYFNTTISFETDGTVMSGLSAEAKIINVDKKGVVSLAADAISYEADNTAYCLVKGANGVQEKRTISLGETDGTYVEITSGLSDGEVVYYVPKSMYDITFTTN